MNLKTLRLIVLLLILLITFVCWPITLVISQLFFYHYLASFLFLNSHYILFPLDNYMILVLIYVFLVMIIMCRIHKQDRSLGPTENLIVCLSWHLFKYFHKLRLCLIISQSMQPLGFPLRGILVLVLHLDFKSISRILGCHFVTL